MNPSNLITPQVKHRILKELYPHASVPLPRLKQVVPDEYHYRGDSSYIRCVECGVRVHNEKRCPKCQTAYNDRQVPYVPLTVEQERRGINIRNAQGRAYE